MTKLQKHYVQTIQSSTIILLLLSVQSLFLSCSKKSPHDQSLVALTLQVQEIQELNAGQSQTLDFDQHWLNAQAEFAPIQKAILDQAKKERSNPQALMSLEEVHLLQAHGLRVLEHLSLYIVAARNFFGPEAEHLQRLKKAYLCVDLMRILFLRSFILEAEVLQTQKAKASSSELIDLQLAFKGRIESAMMQIGDLLKSVSDYANLPDHKTVRERLWQAYMQELQRLGLAEIVEAARQKQITQWQDLKTAQEKQAKLEGERVALRERLIAELEYFQKKTFSPEEKTTFRVMDDAAFRSHYLSIYQPIEESHIKNIYLDFLRKWSTAKESFSLSSPLTQLLALARATDPSDKFGVIKSREINEFISERRSLASNARRLIERNHSMFRLVGLPGSTDHIFIHGGERYFVSTFEYLDIHRIKAINSKIAPIINEIDERQTWIDAIVVYRKQLGRLDPVDFASLSKSQLLEMSDALSLEVLMVESKKPLPQSVSTMVKTAHSYQDKYGNVDSDRSNRALRSYFNDYYHQMTVSDLVRLWDGLYRDRNSYNGRDHIIETDAPKYVEFRLKVSAGAMAAFPLDDMVDLHEAIVEHSLHGGLTNKLWKLYLGHFLPVISLSDFQEGIDYLYRQRDNPSVSAAAIGKELIPRWLNLHQATVTAKQVVTFLLEAYRAEILTREACDDLIYTYMLYRAGKRNLTESDANRLIEGSLTSDGRNRLVDRWKYHQISK